MIRMLKSYKYILVGLCVTLFSNFSFSQGLLDQAQVSLFPETMEGLFTEKVEIISRSGKIFIMSNGNQLLNKGDFITLVIKKEGPVARALVAKTHDESAGIKILKVYSLSRWKKLRKGLNVQILKGDDTALFKPMSANTEEVATTKIETEEDLFKDDFKVESDEDLSGFYKDNRLIRPDNIVGIAYNEFEFKNTLRNGDIEANPQISFTWAYQFADNFWVEGLYGRTQIDSFPASGNQTIINNFTGRFKYTFKAPFYSFIMPYVGFQTYSVSSPQAGERTDDSTAARELAKEEQELVNSLQTSGLAIGATYLKRLVPGWFFKANLGNDIFSIGFSIEF